MSGSHGAVEISSKVDLKLRRLDQLLDSILSKHFELDHEQQTLDTCQTFLEESAQELSQTWSPQAKEDGQTDTTELQGVHVRFQADLAALKTQSNKVRAIQRSLCQMESRLKKRTRKIISLRKASSELVQSFSAQLPEAEAETNTSSSASSVHTDTPPLLATYLDRKGDIGVFRERLLELDYSHNETLAECDFIVDRGDSPEIPLEVVKAEYEEQRKAILEDLLQAESETERLARQCEAAGLQIIDLRRESSSEALSTGSGTDEGVLDTALIPYQILLPVNSRSQNMSLLSPHNQTSIQGWLATVSDPGDVRDIVDIGNEPRLQSASERQLTTASTASKSLVKPKQLPSLSFVTSPATFETQHMHKIPWTRKEEGLFLRRWATDPTPSVTDGLHLLHPLQAGGVSMDSAVPLHSVRRRLGSGFLFRGRGPGQHSADQDADTRRPGLGRSLSFSSLLMRLPRNLG